MKVKEYTNRNKRGLFKVCHDLIFDVDLKRITDILKHKNIRLKQQKLDSFKFISYLVGQCQKVGVESNTQK